MSPRRPNLLLVFADQMRGQDMRCAGNDDLITPVMDRLAAEGVLCERAYATVPLCGPNRATMLTGTYPTRHGLIVNDTVWRRELPTVGTVARDHGYRAGYVGKWHLDGLPRDKFTPPGPRRGGFDDFWAVHNCTHEYLRPEFYRDSPRMVRVPGYEPEVQTQLAWEFLDGQRGEARPFCLVLSWGPPHNPYEQVPENYRRMYDADRLRLRQNCRAIPRECLDPAWSHRATTADYYALITSLDDLLGRLLAKLDELRLADDTLVVFTSDHGDMLWSQGLLYKCVPYEESVSVPLLLRWPGTLPAGRRCGTLIGTVDLLATLSGLLGWRLPESSQGVDLSPALRGEAGATEPASLLLANYARYVFRPDMPTPPWRGVRTPRYTYAEALGREPWRLFDNQRDPFQMTNLAAEPEHAALRGELAAELGRWLKRIGDPFLDGEEMARRFGTSDRWPEEPRNAALIPRA